MARAIWDRFSENYRVRYELLSQLAEVGAEEFYPWWLEEYQRLPMEYDYRSNSLFADLQAEHKRNTLDGSVRPQGRITDQINAKRGLQPCLSDYVELLAREPAVTRFASQLLSLLGSGSIWADSRLRPDLTCDYYEMFEAQMKILTGLCRVGYREQAQKLCWQLLAEASLATQRDVLFRKEDSLEDIANNLLGHIDYGLLEQMINR